jgi:hypothetical protein
MIKTTSKTTFNMKGLEKLARKIKRTKIDVGYMNSPVHWQAASEGKSTTVAAIAQHLHDHSPWAGSFMLSEVMRRDVQNIVTDRLDNFSHVPLSVIAKQIGEDAVDLIQVNIQEVGSPSNSPEWVSKKGFDDPLVFGSNYGYTPNLVSEVKWRMSIA